jgi:hypothetical protein
MPALTRRREKDRQQESWQVFYADVQVGWIGERAGEPKGVEQWGWYCGFVPLTHRGLSANGVAESLDQARSAFEAAWRDYLPQCTEADFDEYRFQRAHETWKRRMWDAGCDLPTQTVSGMTKCFCGVIINFKTSGDHVRARHIDVFA